MAKAQPRRSPKPAAAAAAAGTVRVGVGGWSYPPWRGTFFPAGLPHRRELEYASRHLTSIEINGTYYGLQKPATFAKWRDETPDGFVFAVKAPRFVVNRKVLAGAGPSIQRFLASGITELGEKLGPINWQFMPAKEFDRADFEAFLRLLPKEADGRALRHAVEVRHGSFRCAAFLDLLSEHRVASVIAADSDHPQIADVAGRLVYLRLMGTRASEKEGYSGVALKSWAARAREWAAGGCPRGLEYVGPMRATHEPREVFLYVIGGHKVSNPAAATSLLRRLR